MTWIIQDWTGRQINDEEFDSFGDARERISELATIEADNNYKHGTQDWEDLYNGVCEDLYAVNVDENGDEIPDNGQYSY